MAVDVQPAAQVFAAAGLDPATIPASLNAPSGPSWHRLIIWLLSLGQTLPVAAVPDVVELYTSWSIGMIGLDPLTPALLQHLYRWLNEIETARDGETFRDRREPFGGEIEHERIKSLEVDLRTGFLLFCNRAPELAVEYLRSLGRRRHNEDIVRSILKLRGSLAQAAPAELAELTVRSLISKHQPGELHSRRELKGPFDFLDYEFLPASPAQGPFFDLLSHSPQDGLSLIHRLVDHAISFYSQDNEYGDDAITISFPDSERAFPWRRSYVWSRDETGHNCLTSALMALEAWAHRRIEAGEAFDEVLLDVLGPSGSPAAYLLVAVDLLLSHWPKSRKDAVPFLACPELLCIDRERHLHDNFEYPDLFGLKALQKEPVGSASIRDLEKRSSRRIRLEQLLGNYTFGPVELRESLTSLLRHAAKRLGPPHAYSNLSDPEFMVIHTLNLVDKENWREVSVTRDDGTQTTAFKYMAPEAENRHLAALQEAAQDKQADANMQATLGLALEDPSRSSAKVATAAVEWAQSATDLSNHGDADDKWIRELAIVTAAMIMMRDGDAELRAQHAEWARGVLAVALRKEEDPVHRVRSGLRYNPIAIAFVGLVHSLKDRATTEDVRGLLEVAARGDPAAAHGFGATASVIATFDERLPRALLRCAFEACIRPNRDWNLTEEQVAERSQRYRQRVHTALDAELAWLTKGGAEPDWPMFPAEPVRPRRRLRLPGGQDEHDTPAPQLARQDEHADHQAAALWLANLHSLVDVIKWPWLREIARIYGPWTTAINGAGLEACDEIDRPPRKWNDAYFDLLAHCMPGLMLQEIEQLALNPIVSLPDEPFFDIVTQFLRNIDAIHFNEDGLSDLIAVDIRSVLASRLMNSSGWKRLGGSKSASVETHIGPAVAVFFFNDHGFAQPAKCYLLPKGIDRLTPFLPILSNLVESGPSLIVAVLTLNLLEISPKSAHLHFIVATAKTWLESFPVADDFWVDQDIGRRVCGLIDKVRHQEPTLLDKDEPLQFDVSLLLTGLISLGVADARRLEDALGEPRTEG